MTTLQSFAVTGDTTAQAIANLAHAVGEAPTGAHFVCVFYDAEHEDDAIFDFLRARFERAAILGGTSCNGVMSQNGLAGSRSIGLLVLDDPLGNYGTAATQLHGDAADCAERTLHAALENADCAGELPELIWVYQTPGQEEAVIEGLRRVVGDRCPIIGGSSADNDVGGQWRQMGPDGVIHDGLVVGVLFSSGGIGFAFQGGYEPSGESGIVTRIGNDPDGDSGVVTQSCGRQIISIDGEPAAEVYNRWIGGALEDKLESGGNILANTTMHPVGIDVGKIEGITSYLLIHPDKILADGALSTFASIEEGTRLYSMKGERTRLISRAGKVAAAAAAMLPGGESSLAGGLVVYCGGCMLAVGEEMPRVARAVTENFQGKPFLGCFTFGEQGAILGKNAHGNLMISAVAFGE